MSRETPSKVLYELLVSRNLEPEALGRDPGVDVDLEDADRFKFDWVPTSGRNYGTAVILMGDDGVFQIFFGDHLARTMEPEDKQEWFDFLLQLKNFAIRNGFDNFNSSDINKLKHTLAGQAAIKEGLFESWQGRGDRSWSGQPTEARLIIQHSRRLGEGEARHHHIKSLFIETADQERYKLKFRNLTAGRAMLEHVRQGGNPYDLRGQHINSLVEELAVLSRFRRANAGQVFEGEAQKLVTETDRYYQQMRSVLKHLGNSRGYSTYFESWNPAEVTEQDVIIEDFKNLFVKQTIDPRIEQALPLLARITQQHTMKETEIFESWINTLAEGTWALPETREQQTKLIELLSKELPVGPDATNATEQLYDLVGDDELFDQLEQLAGQNADADARPLVIARLEQMSNAPGVAEVLAQIQQPQDSSVEEGWKGTLAGSAAGGLAGELAGKAIGPLAGAKIGAAIGGIPGAIAGGAAGLAAGGPIGAAVGSLAGGKIGDALGGKDEDVNEQNVPLPDQGKGLIKSGMKAATQGLASGFDPRGILAPVFNEDSGTCNHTMEGEYCPEHGLAECGNYGMYESELARLKSLASVTNEGWKGTLAGSAAGGIAGDIAGKAIGPAAGAALGGALGGPAGAIAGGLAGAAAGPAIGSAIGGLAGGKIGDKLGGQDVDEEDDSAITSTAKKIGSTAGDIYNIPGNIASAFANKVGKEKTDEEGTPLGKEKPGTGQALGTIGGALAGGSAGAMLGGALGKALDETNVDEEKTDEEGTPLGKEKPGTGQALGTIGGALAGGSAGAMLGGALGKALDETNVDEESDTAKVVKGAAKAATQGLGDLVSSSGKEIAKNMLALESNSDSALLARIKSLALLK